MKTALIVIDVQAGMFAWPEYPPFEGEFVVARIADLIARARETDVPVHFVQHDGGPDDNLHPGKPGFAFHALIAPRDTDDVTVKRCCSSFQGTDLDAKLKAGGIDHVVICGMQTEFCVDTAVRAAFERGYKVTLVGDAHTTMDTRALKARDIIAHHNATLGGSFAELKHATEVIL
jgi:nicotinamidase-related amidase